MFGSDWLCKNKTLWSIEDAEIVLGGRAHRLGIRPKSQKRCRRVVLEQDTVVPAVTQTDIPCRIVFNRPPQDAKGQLWGTEPTILPGGIYVARTLTLPGQFANIPVCIMNLNNKAREVHAGTPVSYLEPIDVLRADVTDVQASKVPLGKACFTGSSTMEQPDTQEKTISE